ncbi:MAG: FAD-dependent oxidoreductase [Kiritimatiellae bacterium]|nr:FAD-dependent oxidoreductase [Kiritimatiellia bacterium]
MRQTVFLIFSVLAASLSGAGVVEPAKELVLVQDVDVVVVGGSSGAVAAAIKAKADGASVFLVAQRPFLGEDMAATLRLRLSDDEDARCALLKSIFTADEAAKPSIPFIYKADKKADPLHLDKTGGFLSDGKWMDVPRDSVQYNEDVAFTLELRAEQQVDTISVLAYGRSGDTGFGTSSIEVLGQDGSGGWKSLALTSELESAGHSECFLFKLPLAGKHRTLKVKAVKAKGVARQLLGEISLYSNDPQGEKATMTQSTTPFKVKRALDDALLQAGISFITGCASSEILVDETGKPAGVIISNRSGRQCVKAKVIIDATERGVVARAAGAQATPFPAGNYTFQRMVLAGEAPKAEGLRVQELFGVLDTPVTGIKAPEGMPSMIKGRMFACEIDIPMKDGSHRSFAEAEQRARDLTFVPTQLDEADQLFLIAPDKILCSSSSEAVWQGVDKLDVNCFKPRQHDNLFVLSPMADISRSAAAELMKPGNLMVAGEMIGAAAADAARQRGQIKTLRSLYTATAAGTALQVKEVDTGFPPYLCNTSGTVKVNARELPVLAECDVVVAGAGTGGAPAGISASRHGLKTILCEYIHKMGGVSTDGLIGRYWYGNRVGFTTEIDAGVAQTGAVFVQAKSEWYRAQNRQAGTEIWYGTLVTGVIVEDNRVAGVVVVTSQGERGVIRCKVAIDATGNAVLPAMAGVETQFISKDEVALQGAGQTPKPLGSSYTNTDIGFVDDTDAADVFFFAMRNRMNMPGSTWDQAQVVNSRERRRMVGAFYLTPLDVANQRTYPDVVVQTRSNFDSHGYTVHEQFFIEDPGHHAMMVNLPLRCLLPEKLDGLLVIGLGISAHRDAMPILRMQPDVQNQGYAAGVVAAEALQAGVELRNVDIRAVQKKLIEKKILPADVLTMQDSFPLSDQQMAQAVEELTDKYKGLAVLLTDYARSIPLLKQALKRSENPEAKFVYAHVLAMMGHKEGEDLLIEKLSKMDWDKGWDFRGMGQFNRSVSWVDSYIIALGRAGSRKSLPALVAKAKALTAESEFSHYRALALAFEALGDQAAAPVLAELLALPGVSNKSFMIAPEMPAIAGYANLAGDKERTAALREIACARALFNIGDYNGVAEKVLRAYAADPRGVYSKHARMVLGELML